MFCIAQRKRLCSFSNLLKVVVVWMVLECRPGDAMCQAAAEKKGFERLVFGLCDVCRM